ncbi:efflux RND transporter permease subunit [Magnetococcus sp. PR-3]|uniref:efflux RND transporter permease subunit n=1 Tax=Magnetococcus sp. PR-3 TaxID=3120355 RepID=UPI002FCDE865
MKLVQWFARHPVTVASGVLLLILFGLLSLMRIPVQLTPDIRKPTISVITNWSGAAPSEVESAITIPQESVLKSIPGLDRINANASRGRSRVILRFKNEVDLDSALLMVNNRLQQVREYPDEVDRPSIRTSDSDDQPIVWMAMQWIDPDDPREVAQNFTFVEEVVQPALERVPGVATVNVYGGRPRELRITVQPERLVAYGIATDTLINILRAENQDISAGRLDEGKRAYLVRTTGRFNTPEQVANVVVGQRLGSPVTIGEIADVDWAYREPTVYVRALGRPSLTLNCVREQGANVLKVTEDIHKAIDTLNQLHLNPRGLELSIRYEQTEYIHAALDLVRNNLALGGLLAMSMLMLFLRSGSATVIIALAIPISLIGAFVLLEAMGRTVNVISLAGLAFAVGMVVDPAIVVLENIVRHRQMGLHRFEAAVVGTKQVWGAIFIATATTLAVFVPIIGLKIQAAQLLGDIAVALSAAVFFSLLVAVAVIPTLGARLGRSKTIAPQDEEIQHHGFSHGVSRIVATINRSVMLRFLVIGVVAGGALWYAMARLPAAEYLPSGNRNLIFAMLIPPPGYNLDEMTRLAEGVESHMRPYWSDTPPDDVVRMRQFFFVSTPSRSFMGGVADDPERVKELIPVIKEPLGQIPGMIGIARQSSLFARGSGRGRSLELAITGEDLEQAAAVARQLFGKVRKVIPGSQVRPLPGLTLGNPELRVYPDRLRAAENGLSTQSIGRAVDLFADGLKVDDIQVGGQELDLMIRGREDRLFHTQDLEQLPLLTPSGKTIPLSAVADVRIEPGPPAIRHVDRERAITLRIIPPGTMAMETAIEKVRNELMAPAMKDLPSGVGLRLAEGADALEEAKTVMTQQFLLAMLITYLLMAALFESFLYPLVIIITVPLAAAGGVLGLEALNLVRHQPLDILTMLGFVTLIGIVVNNAILIIHQALNFMHEKGMEHGPAVVESVRIRVRPIFLSTFTSILGLAPLVLFPGAGSELYRGLGSVMMGGLLTATLFTLIVVPALFSLVMDLKARFVKEEAL